MAVNLSPSIRRPMRPKFGSRYGLVALVGRWPRLEVSRASQRARRRQHHGVNSQVYWSEAWLLCLEIRAVTLDNPASTHLTTRLEWCYNAFEWRDLLGRRRLPPPYDEIRALNEGYSVLHILLRRITAQRHTIYSLLYTYLQRNTVLPYAWLQQHIVRRFMIPESMQDGFPAFWYGSYQLFKPTPVRNWSLRCLQCQWKTG